MNLTYKIIQWDAFFYRVCLLNNGKCFFATRLMTKSLAENLVINPNYSLQS